MDFTDYLVSTLPITLLEYMAAVAVTSYYYSSSTRDRASLWLMRFLWLTAVVETVANYAPVAYFSNYELFGFVKGSSIETNYWLYNLFILVTVLFYTHYFGLQTLRPILKRGMYVGSLLYLVAALANLWLSAVFFRQYSNFSFLVGSLLIILYIGLYFGDVLRRDQQIKLRWHMPFYVAVGTLLLYLSMSPLTIYSSYFTSENPDFVSFQARILLFANFGMYLIFIFGSLICRKKTSC